MECTQRLECTQELYGTSQSEKIASDQIGFLGICGKKYPVMKGLNKIGRDPQTCSIVLNLNSVSRLHALINIVNNKEFTIMDLDSANKTRLKEQTLQPYLPTPLRNGDTVQFGEILGMFRLLEEDNDLPMTQALDIPDTPLAVKHVSRINMVTTVPESPDVSDKDDSFIILSQPKGPPFQNPKTRNFIKPGKTIAIQPVGTNKIDNIYWNSSKRSTSLNLDDSNISLNESMPAGNLKDKENKISYNIHELEAQMIPIQKERNQSKDSLYTATTQLPESVDIHTANTQIPETSDALAANTQVANANTSPSIHTMKTEIPCASGPSIHAMNTQMLCGGSPSIHTMNTQIPCGSSPSIHTMNTPMPRGSSPPIHNLNTQLPSEFNSPSIHTIETQIPGHNLPQVCKIDEREEMHFDLSAKKRNESIFNAETEFFPEKENIPINNRNNNDSLSSIKSNNHNISNDIVLFDEVDQAYEEIPESQPILTEDIDLPVNRPVEPDFEFESQIIVAKSAKRNMRINSDTSAHCELDILATKKIKEEKDDDTTDCEDENIIELKIDKKFKSKAVDETDNFEDMPTQVLVHSETREQVNNHIDFEDMPTQVLVHSETREQVDNHIDFEDMPPQVIDPVDIIQKDTVTENDAAVTNVDFEDLPTQVLDEDLTFKKPVIFTKIIIGEEVNNPFKIPSSSALKTKKVSKTPKIKLSEIIATPNNEENKYYEDTQDIYNDLCSQKNDLYDEQPINKTGTNDVLSKKIILNTSVSDIDTEEKVINFVNKLSNQAVLDIIGVDEIAQIKKVPSDGSTASDTENTPTKLRPLKFTDFDLDLPNSQEIKTNVRTKLNITESSSESETENNSEEQCTPILFRQKTVPKTNVKLDLVKKLDVDALPSRVITRVRKPTARFLAEQKQNQSMLKPKFLTEQESEVDKDIITENISRLKKSKTEKKSSAKINKSNIESDKAIAAEISVAEGLKSVRGCRNKTKKLAATKLESKPELSKESSNNTESNNTEINNIISTVSHSKRKRETKHPKKESEDSKNLSSITNTSKNKSLPIVVTKHEVDMKIKRKESERPKSPVETKRIRSTRQTKAIKAEEKSNTTDKDKTEKPKRKYTRKSAKTESKEETKLDKDESINQRNDSPEKETRRSKRQRPVKEDIKKELNPKSILKKTSSHEESAVYNMSSTSNPDTSRRSEAFKRPNLDESEAPYPKRTRSAVTNKSDASGRATPSRRLKTQYVLFTAFPYEAVKVKLEGMGAIVVTDVMQCSVVLTKQIKRTFKLLCAVGLGVPIVGPEWVQACADTNTIVDPWLHLIKDEVAEKRFRFDLRRTLTGKRNFLKGINVSSTPKVMPEAHELKLIVECSGGTWQEGGPEWVCVSTPEDAALWPALRLRGAKIVTTEFILGGVLRQRVDIDVNRYK